ncbi:MAG: FAD-binding oxidoreductase [candidate division KSB1 bacterium]|nr:FAD-binding oxidoreductase [candidate division KSB1 bacterium]MDZ7275425.1 FAD-binding oxidoreductase [candidate division KSB1 bacterium]MDZ7286263.1 FAD-binding oxidoreductase [candidate division KSB1 bacterium]MDZ7296489.1 FAD-binding oxidoreductase [candidate division KSB1 bacterium]MDZ7305553.1 FAD-binding oxidoreductase [candidate division KSB1 bacterium]
MDLHAALVALLEPGRVLTRPLDLIAYASDASSYRLIPQAVVLPKSLREIQALFVFARANRIPLTFRTAGTSLSGQAVTSGILVEVARHWKKIQVEDEGRRVRVQPGVIGSHVNAVLRPYGRRLGPDPASIDACMMGGILANNASGMCCGVVENSYHTLATITYLLPNGVVVNTAEADADERLRQQAPALHRGILALKQRVTADDSLCVRIRAKYRMKNTTGYSLNALLDFNEPAEILGHLMIGSEGTLGFIAEAVLHTLPAYPLRYTGLLTFAAVQHAGSAILPLRDSGARALEIMDRAALRSVEHLAGAPALLKALPEGAAGLLVEYQCTTPEELQQARQAAQQVCRTLTLLHPPVFTEEAAAQALLWKLRKGLFPAIGALRPQGTTVIIEDVAFQVERLAEAITDLQELFHEFGYHEAIIFGHAKDGNLHFVITPSFNTDAEIERYEHFMASLVKLVVEKYDGALKAEHGTGRNIAPFVEAEWGRTAFAIMKELKRLVDPDGFLNPGVIINDDPRAHVRHLKTLPVVETEVDKCIECGFCEPHCPSRRLTLTPRQRIVVRREIARQRAACSHAASLTSVLGDYQYAGLETCAVDGLCATACPVAINTGELVKRLRSEGHSEKASRRALQVARRLLIMEKALRFANRSAHWTARVLGDKTLLKMTQTAERLLQTPLPKWHHAMPPPPRRIPRTGREGAYAVYFPACLTRIMGGPPAGQRALPELLPLLAERAGLPVWIPSDSAGHCCGMPFGSKGYTAAYHATLRRMIAKCWAWSDEGRLPIVIDASSCAHTLRSCAQDLTGEDLQRWRQLTILDSVEFVHDRLLSRLQPRRLSEAVMLHPNCATRKLGLTDRLQQLAAACAESVAIPVQLDCCAFAGDRGLLFPELTQSATAVEAAEVNAGNYDGYYSSNLTCEMGMTLATGRRYQSILYLVERATRKAS